MDVKLSCRDAAAINAPAASIEKIAAGGHPVPFWLEVLRERTEHAGPGAGEELIVPE